MKFPSLAGLLRTLRWHRRGVAVVAALVLVFAGLNIVAGRTAGEAWASCTTREVSAGTTLGEADVTRCSVPAELIPVGASDGLDTFVGAQTTVHLPAGVILIDSYTVGGSIAAKEAGEVLVPFHLDDPSVVSLLRVGDRITVVGTTPEGSVLTIGTGIRVAGVQGTESDGGLLGSSSEGVIIGATDTETAKALAAADGMSLGVIFE